MRFKFIAVTACALFAATSAAMADTHLGWYVAADVGAHQTSTQHLTVTDTEIISSSSSSSSESSSGGVENAPALRPQAEVVSDEAYTGPYALKTRNDAAYFLRGGYQFTPNWRAELELGKRPGKISHSIATNATEPGPYGKFDQTTAMINLLYDIAPESNIHPYIGAGVGAVQIKTNYTGDFSTSSEVHQTYSIQSKKTVAGAQLIAGLTWAATSKLSVDLTYRYLQTAKVRYDVMVHRQYIEDQQVEDAARGATNARVFGPMAEPVVVQDVVERDRMSGRFNDQSLSIGLRWAFGSPSAPPPPPAPAYTPEPPAPPPAPQAVPLPEPGPPPVAAPRFIVYFEFDRATITPDGQSVVDAAANYAKNNSVGQVAVVGHADTSGSAAYNIKLSEKRAKAVASALVKDGVASDIVSTDWKGESDPAVATGDGVKEPLNRRATIDFGS